MDIRSHDKPCVEIGLVRCHRSGVGSEDDAARACGQTVVDRVPSLISVENLAQTHKLRLRGYDVRIVLRTPSSNPFGVLAPPEVAVKKRIISLNCADYASAFALCGNFRAFSHVLVFFKSRNEFCYLELCTRTNNGVRNSVRTNNSVLNI